MRINILLVENGVKESMEIDELVRLDAYGDVMNGFLVSEPVAVSGQVRNAAQSLPVSLQCKAQVDTVCARCAKEIRVPVAFHINSFAVKEEDVDPASDFDVIPVHDHDIDLGEIVWEQLLLHMDISYLCGPGCKGLCPTCGKDLNEGGCTCLEEAGDARLAVLKNFLQ